jgi:hypothetical protein
MKRFGRRRARGQFVDVKERFGIEPSTKKNWSVDQRRM